MEMRLTEELLWGCKKGPYIASDDALKHDVTDDKVLFSTVTCTAPVVMGRYIIRTVCPIATLNNAKETQLRLDIWRACRALGAAH